MRWARKMLSKLGRSRKPTSNCPESTDFPESYAHGLFILHPPPELPANRDPISVDIVAIHGLNGKARETWEDKQTGMLWLEDFLPEAMPDAQVMTFGYDSSLLLSNSRGGIEDFARDLLNRLWVLREGRGTRGRPLIFVAHSLGGIVVKKALVLAHENHHQYGDIVSSTIGIVFMGTPHRGSEIVDWTSFLRNLVYVTSGTHLLRTDLIKQLSTHSSILLEISKSFLPRSADLNIMSFIELQIERPLTTLVVPEESARLNLPNERVFPVNTHHRNICRFPSDKDQTYVLVEGSLKEIVRSGSKVSTSKSPVFNQFSTAIGTRDARFNPIVTGISEKEINSLSSLSNNSASGLGSPSSSKTPASTVGRRSRKSIEDDDHESETSIALADVVDESSVITIRVGGIKPKLSASEKGWTESSLILRVRDDTEFSGLKRLVDAKYPEMKPIRGFMFSGRPSPISIFWVDCFTTPVRVTDGRPCYKVSSDYRINARQSMATFFSKAFPNPISAKIHRYPQWMQSSTGMSHCITAGRGGAAALQISFMRTVRIKGDDLMYMPPKGLGTFPLYNTLSYRDRLPADAAAKGGLFFPMHAREAMWIAFDCPKSENFAIRPFTGGINGISGDSLLSPKITESNEEFGSEQDYITVPEQKRLDGVVISPGRVRQFVATNLTRTEQQQDGASSSSASSSSSGKSFVESQNAQPGKGRTVEWQMTGKDEIGGIQLQIIPKFETERMFAGSAKDVAPGKIGGPLKSYQPLPADAGVYDVLKTPGELGLRDGDSIHIKRLSEEGDNRSWVKLVRDLLAEAPESSGSQYDIELEPYRIPSCEKILAVRDSSLDGSCEMFKVDSDDKLEDVQEAARELFQNPEGVLHICGIVTNNPDLQVPATNWEDPNLPARAAGSEEITIKNSIFRSLKDARLDLVLLRDYHAAPISRSVCSISFFGSAIKYFSSIRQPLVLEMPRTSTASNLRRIIETMAGLPTESFRILSAKCARLDDDSNLFDEDNGSQRFSMPAFAIADDGVLLITLTGKQIFIPAVGSDTVATLKQRVEDVEGIQKKAIRLIHAGRLLRDEETVSVLDTPGKHCRLAYLSLNTRGGGAPKFVVMVDRVVVFRGFAKHVKALKEILEERLGVLRHRQILKLDGLEVSDDLNLSMGNGDLILDLVIRPLPQTTLGIGVGGNIMQDIVPDSSDPRLWDVASSKTLYIHIVNSDVFELITGLSPPKMPTNAVANFLAGFPFNQQQSGDGLRLNRSSFNGVFSGLVGVGDTEEVEEWDEGESSNDPFNAQRGVLTPTVPLTLLQPDQTIPWFRGKQRIMEG